MLTADAIKALVTVMAPYVGETMAHSAAEAQCHKLGVAGDSISPEQLEALLVRLGSGLNIFIGREKSSAAVEQMRAGLRGMGEAR